MAAGAALQLQDAFLLTEVSAPVEVFALPEVFSLVEKANFQALSASLQVKDLYDEVSILQRLAYKNNNQHRASKHYQAVRQVLKVLQLFQQMQLPTLLQHLHTAAARTALPEAPSIGGSSKRARRQQQQQPQQHPAAQRQTVRLPSFQAGCCVLRRLLSGAQLLLDLHYAILSAGQHLSGQLSRGYFMPFCLVAAAAVARIRVLATAGLLELLQAYNSLAQLLPLLPPLPAATPAGAATTSTSTTTTTTIIISSSSFVALNSDSLPQMLQLSWNGPLPALRSIPFDDQGSQSLQALAAELQQTYCVSRSSSSSSSGGNRDNQPAAAVDEPGGRQQSAGGQAVGADVGMAISREAFAQQLGQQQQQQGNPTAFSISFFEDKQPDKASSTPDIPQQPSVAVPLYSTVPGLGFSLGQQHQPCVPVALGAAAAAASGQAVPVPEHSSAVGSVRGLQAMEVDEFSAEDQQEYLSLYGKQTTPTQQQQPPQQQQQQQQQQLTGSHINTAGQPAAAAAAAAAAVGVHRGLQASAALLAMQQSHSSDDDEDMGVAQPVATATGGGLAVLDAQAVQQQQAQGHLAMQQQQQQVAAALLLSGGGPHDDEVGQRLQQSQQNSQHPSQHPSQPAAALGQKPKQPVSASAPAAPAAPAVGVVLDPGSAAAGGSSRQIAGKGAPTLQALKKSRQKKKGKQKAAAEAPQDAPAAAAPRDSILDMLLQGL